ncbi:sigma-70 family RNA polymerase sigma factor [Streptomyces sp. PU-14G]|uniref:sigma-70 family RNA polymerase sigma factor n=1 Tax=Streptomyces sp. PU-14G TaxID=2800808 RepID=UPI0034DF82B9
MRKGDDGAYEELYRRHAEPVRRYARTCCRDADTAEDLTGEVFARTLQAVRGGKGPRTAVRAYLLTSVRHVAAAWTRTRRRERLVDDFAVFVQSAAAASGARDVDTLDLGADVRAMHKAEQTLVVRAFESLSEHDRMLLWHTAVEGDKPQDVAVLLGTSRGAVATAAHRAREHLKQAYLQAHVSRALTQGGECARYADRLGAYARGGLRMRAERGLARHLEGCAACSQAASEVRDLNEHIRLVLPVALVGWFGTAGGAKAFAALLGGGAAAGGAAAGGAAAGGAGASGAGTGAATEGLGTPAKVGIGLGVAAAAGAVLAYALTGGDEPVEKPRARPSAPHAAPDQPPRKPEPEPPGPRPEPRQPTAHPPAPRPQPVRAAPQRPAPKTEPGPGEEPVRRPGPRPTAPEPEPEPTRKPRPEPSAPPSPPSSRPPASPPAERHVIRVTEHSVVLDSTAGEHTVRLVVERQPSLKASASASASTSASARESVASWAHSLSRRAAASAGVRGGPVVSGPSPGSSSAAPAQ